MKKRCKQPPHNVLAVRVAEVASSFVTSVFMEGHQKGDISPQALQAIATRRRPEFSASIKELYSLCQPAGVQPDEFDALVAQEFARVWKLQHQEMLAQAMKAEIDKRVKSPDFRPF